MTLNSILLLIRAYQNGMSMSQLLEPVNMTFLGKESLEMYLSVQDIEMRHSWIIHVGLNPMKGELIKEGREYTDTEEKAL